MGKVVGAILQTLGTVVFMALGTAVGGPIGTAIGAAIGSQVGGLLGGLFVTNPKPEQGSVAIKKPRPERISAYGEMRLYGAYILFENADGKAVDVWAVHDGQLTLIVQFYLNDDKVTVAGDGAVSIADSDGRYSVDGESKVSLFYTNGASPGVAFPQIVSALPGVWTNDHRGDGVVLLGQIARPVKSEVFLETFPNGVPVPSVAAKWQKCPDLHAADPTDESEWTWTCGARRRTFATRLFP